MKKGIIGKKIGMTQIFDESGKVVPVTVVEAGPCTVVQKKTAPERRLRRGPAGLRRRQGPTRSTSPMKGHFDKADVAPKKSLREFRFDDCGSYNVGDIIKADAPSPAATCSRCLRDQQR